MTIRQKLVILAADMQLARERIAHIEQALRDMAPEIQEALDQSSETWHDNAPFEVLRDRRSAYLQEITNIKTILTNSTKQIPAAKRGTVGIGSTVLARSLRTGEQRYYIAGDWTLRTGQQHDAAVVVSRQSPIGALLMGKRPGDTVVLNGNMLTVREVA